MKSGTFWKWSLGLALSTMPFIGGCVKATTPPPVHAAATATEAADVGTAAPAAEEDTVAVSAPTAGTTVEPGPASTEKPAPVNVRLSSPASEIARLANSGVAESVMLAYVTNSTSTFNLGADEIIYLNDIGVPGTVVAAMMQRDQALKALPPNLAAEATAPFYTAYVAPTNPPAAGPGPTPAEVAPQAVPTATTYPPAPPSAPAPSTAYPTFYDALTPYGNWVYTDDYGWCWQPTMMVANPGWTPYFDGGHWVYTDYGWYWLSDYSWGWAPFHYGRWFRHHHYGWCWAPDTVWGPSWVSWRYTDNYCGWAPLPPAACYSPGFGFTWYGHSVAFGFDFGLGVDCYRFVHWRHFHHHHLYAYRLPPQQVNQFYNKTVVVNKVVVHNGMTINQGVPLDRIPAATRKQVPQLAIREVNGSAPGGRRAEQLEPNKKMLTVFKPQMPQPTRTAATVTGPSRNEVRRDGSVTATSKAQVSTPASPSRPVETKTQQPRPAGPAFAPVVSKPTPAVKEPLTARTQPTQTPTETSTSRTANPRPQGNRSAPAPGRREQVAAPNSRAVGQGAVPPGSPIVSAQPGSTRPQTPDKPSSRSVQVWPPQSTGTPAARNTQTSRPNPPAAPPSVSPQNSFSRSTPNQPPQTTRRPETTGALPWLQTRSGSTPATAPRQSMPSYQPPVRTAPAEVPRYTPPPAAAPQRSYSAPAMPSYSRPQVTETRSAPARAPVAEAPRYSPPPAMSSPSRAPAMESRPAPSAPAASSSRNSSDKNGRN